MYKVRKYHSWNTVPYKERSLIQAHERLSLVGLNNGINQSAIESSRTMYCTIKEVGGRQGLSRDAMLAGCMFVLGSTTVKPSAAAKRWNPRTATTTRAALDAVRGPHDSWGRRSEAEKSATSFSVTSLTRAIRLF